MSSIILGKGTYLTKLNCEGWDTNRRKDFRSVNENVPSKRTWETCYNILEALNAWFDCWTSQNQRLDLIRNCIIPDSPILDKCLLWLQKYLWQEIRKKEDLIICKIN